MLSMSCLRLKDMLTSVQRMFVTSCLFSSMPPTKILDMVKKVVVKCTQKTRVLMQQTEEGSSLTLFVSVW